MWPPLSNNFAQWTSTPSNWLDIVLGTVGFGAEDNPAGRRDAYLQLIAPFDTPSAQKQYGKLSGCALSALGWMRAWGLDDVELWRPYKVGRAVAAVVTIARCYDAWDGPDSEPEMGDLVLIGGAGYGGAEHVFCAIDKVDGKLRSVDGGQVERSYQAIKLCERPMFRRGSQLIIGNRRIQGVARINKMLPTRSQVRPIVLQ